MEFFCRFAETGSPPGSCRASSGNAIAGNRPVGGSGRCESPPGLTGRAPHYPQHASDILKTVEKVHAENIVEAGEVAF